MRSTGHLRADRTPSWFDPLGFGNAQPFARPRGPNTTSFSERKRMCVPRLLRPLALLAVCLAPSAFAQVAQIPVRAVSAPTATTAAPISSIDELREIADGRVLVNTNSGRQLLMFDASLATWSALADTTGNVAVYPRFARLFPYLADSTFLYESDSRSLVLIDPKGKLGRVVALPHPPDFNLFSSGAPIGTDARGRLIYQGRRPFAFPPSCRLADETAPVQAPAAAPTDSIVLIRADFETRTVDTIGKTKTVVAGLTFPITTTDANCKVLSAKVRVNPSVPATDAWTVTSRGAVAMVRGHDYHIDWIDPDGSVRSSPKMPYDWRRLTDADKQAKIDSARRIIDSLTAIGGYRLEACGRGFNFNTNPPAAGDGPVGVSRGGGGAGLSGAGRAGAASGEASLGNSRPTDCQTVTVAVEFVPLDSMTDYLAPIREQAARADLDGNVWILPSTSAGARGGLLYDVVSPKGELVERVQLPAGRDIAGFGRGAVLYLKRGDYKTGFLLERVKVVRM